MSVSDVVSGSGLTLYAVVALVLFFAAFCGVVVFVFCKANRETFDKARQMPLDDATPQTPRRRPDDVDDGGTR